MLTRLTCSAALIWLAVAPSVTAHGSFHEMMDELAVEMTARPQDSTLYVRRTQLYLEHGEWKAALTDIERAERLGSDTAALDLLRAQALALGGLHTQADALLSDFLKDHAEHGFAHLVHARVLAKMERFDESLKAYRTGLRRTADPEPDLYLEIVQAFTAQKLNSEAIELLQLGIARRGNVPSLVLKVMELEIAQAKYDAALARVEVMQQQAPRPEPWMARRAALLQQASRTQEARAAWTTLRDHILGLPNLERGSHAMSLILEETQRALAAPASAAPETSTPSL